MSEALEALVKLTETAYGCGTLNDTEIDEVQKTIRTALQRPSVDVDKLRKPESDRYPTTKNEKHCFNEGWNQCIDHLASKGIIQQWQPIETAPKDGTFILCCHESGHVNILQWSEHANLRLRSLGGDGGYDAGWRKGVSTSRVVWKPTHWMPLPTPPKESEGSDE